MSTETDFKTFTLSQLVAKYSGGIRIPMIQRDYAQGRLSWTNSRSRFLKDLEKALSGGKPHHLDFVYGIQQVEDGIDAFSPLDGQQRLTTLFLLHWYLAARDGRLDDFRKTFQTALGLSKFSYQARPGGRSFFQTLVKQEPQSVDAWKGEPSKWIDAQPWFRTIWKRDPTVAGALVMLDAIAKKFIDHEGDYEQLVNGERITFHTVDLGAAGLFDDLYLRMNARGRALTPFETFKARYEKHLVKEFPDVSALAGCTVRSANDFTLRIDNEWLDFIWNRYGPKVDTTEDTGSVDAAFMNLFQAVALVSLPPKEKDNGKDDPAVVSLSAGLSDYDDFKEGKWLTPRFTTHVIHVLEALTGDQGEKNLALLSSPWFDNGSLLDRVVRYESAPLLTDFLQFATWVRFITRHGPVLDEEKIACFHEWMRVVRNLVLNTDIRSDSFRRHLAGLDQLLEDSENILQALAASTTKVIRFNPQQIEEERLKATLICKDKAGWWPLIQRAEDHGYFRGQIDFLLEFSGAKKPDDDHVEAQRKFRMHFDRAQEMFDGDGLRTQEGSDFLWERALLAVGDYLLRYGGTGWSFLANDRSSPVSWKRLLRDDHGGRRNHLQTLWDGMDAESLEAIVGHLPNEPWRKALCFTPAAWAYCGQRLIRFEEREGKPPRVFLLSAQRRSTAYAELFTYCLMKQEGLEDVSNRSRFSPLEFKDLRDRTGSKDEPHLRFEFEHRGKREVFRLYCQYGDDTGYSLWLPAENLDTELPQLLENAGFVAETLWGNDYWLNRQNPGAPLNGVAFLDSVAAALRQGQHPS